MWTRQVLQGFSLGPDHAPSHQWYFSCIRIQLEDETLNQTEIAKVTSVRNDDEYFAILQNQKNPAREWNVTSGGSCQSDDGKYFEDEGKEVIEA